MASRDVENQPFPVVSQAVTDCLYDLSSQLRRVEKLSARAGELSRPERLLGEVAGLTEKCTETNRVVTELQNFPAQDLSPVERNQRSEFVGEFSSLLAKVKAVQSNVAVSVKNQALPDSETHNTPAQSNEPNEQTPLMQVQVLDQLNQAQLDIHGAVVNDRANEIAEVQRGMQEINIIFRDIGVLINEQGAQIDSIEDNITDLAQQTEQAGRQLAKAENYQKSRGRWSCIALAILLVLTILVGINVVA